MPTTNLQYKLNYFKMKYLILIYFIGVAILILEAYFTEPVDDDMDNAN